ncbi:MAG TPA: Flp pilus assembly protein CpaB [Bryobacteraceae bacterium]|jgi:pilus assembly protein CpaB
MNRRLVSVLFFALIVAGITSYLLYRLILVRMQSQGRPVAGNKLVVAKHDLQVGSLIHSGDLDEVSWGGPIPGEAVKTIADAEGRGVIANIYQNEPILERRLASKGAGAGLAATIPMGMRAVALRVNEVVGLAGFVLPGMRVDVLVAGNAPDSAQSRAGTLCRTVLQNIEVLSAGQKIEKNVEGKPESAQVVNLLVTPDQAETLNLASTETKVQLVLRNPLDTKAEATQGTSVARLFGMPALTPVAAHVVRVPVRTIMQVPVHHEREVSTVEIFRGGKRTEETFAAPQGKN